jgi:hypothetical protein
VAGWLHPEYYLEHLEQQVGRYEALEKGRLQRLSISGSALKPNLEESQAWQEELKRIQSEYASRVNKLKENFPLG